MNNFIYTDDTILIAMSEKDLRTILLIKEHSGSAGLYLNAENTKSMSAVELQDFRLNNEHFKVVDSFYFLESKIDISGGCEKGITKQMAMGENAMNSLTTIMKDSDISIKTKTRIAQTIVFPSVGQ